METVLTTNTSLEFKSIQTEKWRTYTFPNDEKVTVDFPEFLNVSKSGTHRIVDANGISHLIPSGWIHLMWEVRQGSEHFSF